MMEPRNRRKLVVASLIGAAAVVVMLGVWNRREPVKSPEPQSMRSVKKPVFELMPTPVPARLERTPPRVEMVAEQKTVRVKANQVLATVNRIPVTLKDLMAAGSEEVVLPVGEYEYLLDRAMEREAVFQAAWEQGVRLTEGQMGELERIHAGIMGGEMEKDGSKVTHLNVGGSVKERAEFAVRDAAGLMLIVNLMVKAGLPADLPERRTEYQQARQGYSAKLRSDHVVSVVPTTPR